MVIRGIGDLGSSNNNNAQGGPNNRPMPSYNQGNNNRRSNNGMSNQNVVVIGGDDDGGNAAFPPMNKILARDFNINTFIFWISIIQFLMFIVELLYGQFEYDEMFSRNNVMAGPGPRTMEDLGGKKTSLIQDGQLYRLVTPCLLHGGVLHIFMNMVFQTMLCYTYEKKWGTGRIAYFIFYNYWCFGALCDLFHRIGLSRSIRSVIWYVGLSNCVFSHELERKSL
eukprot:UN31047